MILAWNIVYWTEDVHANLSPLFSNVTQGTVKTEEVQRLKISSFGARLFLIFFQIDQHPTGNLKNH